MVDVRPLEIADSELKTVYLKAQKMTLPDDPLAELQKFEAEALSWPDNPEKLPQKSEILSHIRRAARFLKESDTPRMKLEIYRMLMKREAAAENYLLSAHFGKNGGSSAKVKEWAHEAARLLREDIAGMGMTENEAWEHMPDGTTFEEVELPDLTCDVYRDGEKLCAVSPTGKMIGELTKSTFLKEYYRPAKSSGT